MTQRIVSAANQFFIPQEDGDVKELVICGARHYDRWMHKQLAAIDPNFSKNKYKCMQGFIDNEGNFLTREEAWIVAEREGQIRQRVGGDNPKLFSENLY